VKVSALLPHEMIDPDESPKPPESGAELIRQFARTLPQSPGVYRMVNAGGDVLYVGKARNLRARVTSYTRLNGLSTRIMRMVALTASMEFVTTRTEAEAFLLEANLIKRLMPRFNVLLRDDKSFPYILLDSSHKAIRIVKHRGAQTAPGDYYGPFASGIAVSRTITALQKAFLLRSCADSVYDSRTRPCLLHQIKRCSAPCTGEISPAEYDELVNESRAFLAGKSAGIRQAMVKAMEDAAEQLDYESAARYRDRLAALTSIQSHQGQGVNPQSVTEADVFGIHQEGGHSCVQVFFFRAGQNWGTRTYFPRADSSLRVAEILDSFLGQFYADKPAPRLILLSHEVESKELLCEMLQERMGHAITLATPQRGEKRELVNDALRNAREALARRLVESSSQSRLLAALADTFGLEAPPRRIEIYDNSHISGSSAIGAMVVAGPEGFVKNQYRKFNITSPDTAPGDDFAMMREVFQRRFKRLITEHARGEEDASGSDLPLWPDLVLVDGGQGQLTAVTAIMEELGLTDIQLVGVAKGRDRDAGRETFVMTGREPFRLEPRDPVLYFIQRLRDEAHRFAIGTHRVKRSKDTFVNPLDDIPGIGPGRKRALLHHFGSARAVAKAEVSEIEQVAGINRRTAQLIFDFFNEKRS
jgi:excinuclease ABC subunit C